MTRSSRWISAAVFSIIPASFASFAPERQLADLPRIADSLVSARVAADSFSGVVLVARAGKLQYQRAAGLADRERGRVMQLNTQLQIASATKLFTQIAIRQLEQAGKLSLSDTVGKFLPDYPNSIVRSRVTIEQLLRHRSGVGSFWNEKWRAQAPNIRSVRDYMQLFQDDSLLFEPGTSQAYSNGGYVLLGAIIEQVSGMAYHDYLREKVFRPAGMTETVPYDRRVSRSNAAIGYTTQTLNVPLSGTRRPNTSMQPGMSGPAGDHYSTVGDFLKLADALLGYRLLDSARTTALLGVRYAAGQDFRANGGGPGTNAEFSIYPGGEVIVVLSNYDPPSGTAVAQYLRSLIAPPPAAAPH
ncbi:MAG TPA: serine hydrolase domain-containing protein [Gemmatimonadales bacterium]|jgi:CubicO group peptidase (beta-lactamase class C family)|nr:serine hydrolase domain-containing protein [Gemmatimonadales bacterium]